jgi:hypothetical protein
VASLLPNEPQAYTDGLAVMFQLLEAGFLDIQSERTSSDFAENESLNATDWV